MVQKRELLPELGQRTWIPPRREADVVANRPKRVTGEAGEYRDRLVEFVIRQGIELEFKESIAPAMGVSYGGSQPHSYTEIGRLERQNFSNTFSR